MELDIMMTKQQQPLGSEAAQFPAWPLITRRFIQYYITERIFAREKTIIFEKFLLDIIDESDFDLTPL